MSDLLINFYAIAVVIIMSCPYPPAITCCSVANATPVRAAAATIAATANVVFYDSIVLLGYLLS
jgi:hypothetical protein